MAKAKNEAVTTVDILKYARALLARRGGWTKGDYAKDKNGAAIDPRELEAHSFCAYGARIRATHDLNSSQSPTYRATNALDAAAGKDIVDFNDAQRSKGPVLKAFDRAIAKLEASNA